MLVSKRDAKKIAVQPSLKYLTAILIPPVAVIGSGMVLSGIVNAILWASSGVLFLSGFAWFLFFGTPVPLLFLTSAVLWLAATAHAVLVVRGDDEARCLEEEEALLTQQMDLMRHAAESRASTHRGKQQPAGVTGETKSGGMNAGSKMMRAENPAVEKILRDEVWLESERRGHPVDPDDPVVSARVAEIIRANLGSGFRQRDDS